MSGVEKPRVCQLSSPSGDMCSSPHCREVTLPTHWCRSESWGVKLCAIRGTGKKNTSHHCGAFRVKVILFFKESVVIVIGLPPNYFEFTIFLVQSFLFFFLTSKWHLDTSFNYEPIQLEARAQLGGPTPAELAGC